MSLSRPLLIGLIASAALNVFLIGGVAGMAYMRLSAPPAAAPPTTPAPQPAIAPPVEPPPAAAPIPRPVAPAHRQPPRAPVIAAPPPEPPPAQVSTGERPARPPLWTAANQLSPQARKALRQALHAANQKNQPITRQARAERQAAMTVLQSDNFDPAEVSRRLASARSLDQQARGNVEAALAAYAATLTPSERAILADGLSRIYAPQRPVRQGVDNP